MPLDILQGKRESCPGVSASKKRLELAGYKTCIERRIEPRKEAMFTGIARDYKVGEGRRNRHDQGKRRLLGIWSNATIGALGFFSEYSDLKSRLPIWTKLSEQDDSAKYKAISAERVIRSYAGI